MDFSTLYVSSLGVPGKIPRCLIICSVAFAVIVFSKILTLPTHNLKSGVQHKKGSHLLSTGHRFYGIAKQSHLCEEILNRNGLHSETQEYGTVGQSVTTKHHRNAQMMVRSKGSCRLNFFTKRDVVACFDQKKKFYGTPGKGPSAPARSNRDSVHIAFIGDSRIRQQFQNFLEMLPDYDRLPSSVIGKLAYHSDTIIRSELNNIVITFRWHPLIDEILLDDISQWIFHRYESDTLISENDKIPAPPDIIIIGTG